MSFKYAFKTRNDMVHTSFTPSAAGGAENLGSSSDRHARFVLFDEVTLLQVLEKLPHIVLGKVPADAELAANLIDDR